MEEWSQIGSVGRVGSAWRSWVVFGLAVLVLGERDLRVAQLLGLFPILFGLLPGTQRLFGGLLPQASGVAFQQGRISGWSWAASPAGVLVGAACAPGLEAGSGPGGDWYWPWGSIVAPSS
ncbi:hypothetical protein NDU88_003659 [Pleurodeles waltl]|uniref:Uncharacterized protein n=1 Tax=Pleurodeles waltl TaxID=8319 RepID=A0AAV7T677_PLEWA|nr:hypothetical protein NDU88_003659 [Pleurodeles waltl]